jgi:hypothetical protein
MSETADLAEISLAPDEAIVLFDLLSRWIDDRDAPAPGVHVAYFQGGRIESATELSGDFSSARLPEDNSGQHLVAAT